MARLFCVLAILGSLTTFAATGSKTWAKIAQLEKDQQYDAALKLARAELDAAHRRHDEDAAMRALVESARLQLALGEATNAVELLRSEARPRSAVNAAILDLYLGKTLQAYFQTYRYEILQREQVDTRAQAPLQTWTAERLGREVQQAFARAWKHRAALGEVPLSRVTRFVEPNTYPKGIRSTLRDALTYLWVETLADSTLWRPEDSSRVWRLPFAELVAGDPAKAATVRLEDPDLHPLVALGAVLADLEAWHAGSGNRAAALEARIVRLEALSRHFGDDAQQAALRKDLQAHLARTRDLAWWSYGQASLARMLRSAQDNIGAHAAASAGAKAYPKSVGGKLCRELVAELEAPDFNVQAMLTDAGRRRSVEVTARNLPSLYFRAYRIDLERFMRESKDYNLLPNQNDLPELLASEKPVARWTVALPATHDFQMHRTFVTPPLDAKGGYVIVASAREDFGEKHNRRLAFPFLVSDLVLRAHNLPDGGGLAVEARNGASGAAVPGVVIRLYRFDYHHGHRVAATQRTDGRGEARFEGTPSASYFLVAAHGEDLAVDPSAWWIARSEPRQATRSSLIFTDRAVYRPNQTLHWKVVAFERSAEETTLHTLEGQKVTVRLLDANGTEVVKREVSTNSFGSAAGEFAIPAGRLLGMWTVKAEEPGGAARVRVEEYKRPTFEVSLDHPAQAPRINRKVTLKGHARYYFGLPVPTGKVAWRVTRAPVFPLWWEWIAPRRAPRVIAGGVAQLAEDGSFEVAFTPEGDENAEAGVTYAFKVDVDVTDEGGETRSADLTFRLGKVAVEARIQPKQPFGIAGQPLEVTVTRTDLDGTPRAGQGTYRVNALVAPERVALPAELAVKAPREGFGPHATEGDRLRPRWTHDYDPKDVLRDWKDGQEVARGALGHGADGVARAQLKGLPPGAYRLHYRTEDAYGQPYETAVDLLVTGSAVPAPLAAVLEVAPAQASVGKVVRVLAFSGLVHQPYTLRIFHQGKVVQRRDLQSGGAPAVIEVPVTPALRGGFSVELSVLRDHQQIDLQRTVAVPWDDKALKVSFSSFRDRLQPGAKETWKVKVSRPDGKPVEQGAAEVLAFMYDQALDIFGPLEVPSVLSLYPNTSGIPWSRATLTTAPIAWMPGQWFTLPGAPTLKDDALRFLSGYGIGGPGRRRFQSLAMRAAAPSPSSAPQALAEDKEEGGVVGGVVGGKLAKASGAAPPSAPVALRSNFSESAFWFPQLLSGADGSVEFSFTVPDSVTGWNVWVSAITRGLSGGQLHAHAESAKPLMVRPYLPRFLREGDQAQIEVVLNNATEEALQGTVHFDLEDPETHRSLAKDFGLTTLDRPFTVEAKRSAKVSFPIRTPARPGPIAVRVVAKTARYSDGELRPLPVLPSRVHLTQSRFVSLHDADTRTMSFPDLAKKDPTRINDQLVVTVDAQLFYQVLAALPYLVNYPYECTEQTLNRFLSTGIVTSLYGRYPAVASMARKLSARKTPLETWSAADPNRKMALEETPWLAEAKGGPEDLPVINVLDPRIAQAQRDEALQKLRQAQTSLGAFPWFPGGPPSPYMTLYLMYGFAKAANFNVPVPRDVVERGWSYLGKHFHETFKNAKDEDRDWEFLTFLNFVASSYPDASWTGDALTQKDRERMLAVSRRHWRDHSPYLKAMLAWTLKRMGHPDEAKKVFASVMDSAKTTRDEGTFWVREDRSWLWYRDTTESHAFALRTLMALEPKDPRREGLVQWLFLHKKLNHWESTRATAEVLTALVAYLQQEHELGIPEAISVSAPPKEAQFHFDPDVYSGKNNQLLVPGTALTGDSAKVTVTKESKGLAFASASWTFSTEKLPTEGSGDFFSVQRRYFKRVRQGNQFVLQPLKEGAAIAPGDEVEVHLSLRTKHDAEYVHLRDPRAAGLEPEELVSGYRYDLGLGYYEEVRDSGANFFFEVLPVGEYTFHYRLRANLAGTFRVGPATVQSMYAPEFNAYSAGATLTVTEAK